MSMITAAAQLPASQTTDTENAGPSELHILWSELSQRKLSPTLATADYSCPDNVIGLVA